MPESGPLPNANQVFNRTYPGERAERQPVHTVYGGGHLFRSDTTRRLGALAQRALNRFGETPAGFAAAVGLASAQAESVYTLIVEKLAREPVEDYRIDFEDGYGRRPDAEEDGDATRAAGEVARGMEDGTLPPFIGIRIKPLNEELRRRSVKTLELFIEALAAAARGTPPGFVVTLPKIVLPEQVSDVTDRLSVLEERLGLPAGSVPLELMVEMPQAILGPDGRCPLLSLVAAGAGRVRGAHFGTYDYTAGLGISAPYQRMSHPVCDLAKGAMQVALAGTGVWLSDGATATLPVAPHRPAEGEALAAELEAGNRESVYRAWAMHFADVRHSLETGFYQGWDLHPAQLPTRYAAVFGFFREGLEAAGARLRNLVARAAQATVSGDVFDDAATGQGLLNYLLRAVNSGAVSEAEAVAVAGLTREDLQRRDFRALLTRG